MIDAPSVVISSEARNPSSKQAEISRRSGPRNDDGEASRKSELWETLEESGR